MKEKLTKNIGLKLMSFAMAFLLWVVVINLQDPLDTVTFEDVPVTIINEASLTAKDKIPEIVEGDKITVRVQAKRSICEKLEPHDIHAIADFEKVSVTEAVPIEVSVAGYTERDVEIVRGLNQVMKLRLEDLVSKDFRIKVVTTGELADGYVVGDVISSPNMITVTGSKTQISKIKDVVLEVNVDGVSSELLATAKPLAYDTEGELVNAAKLSYNVSAASVKVPVLKTKTVRVNVYSTGEVEEGYEIINVSYQPDKVVVAGTPEELRKLGSSIAAYCDITGKTGTIEENIEIASLIDSELTSIRLVEEETLAVTIQISEFEEKSFELPKNSIEIRSIPEGMTVMIESISSNKVTVKGKRDRLALTTLERLAPYIDLSNTVSTGICTLPVSFVLSDDMQLVGEILVTVQISGPELD